jgi:hypothetical protein
MHFDMTQTSAAPKRKPTAGVPGPNVRATKQGRTSSMPRLPKRGLSSASMSSASNNGEGQSNFQESVMSPSLLSTMPPTAAPSNRGPSKKATSSATTVNLSRYQSDMGWSGGSTTGAGRQQQNNESQQIKEIKVKCLQEMKEKRRQVRKTVLSFFYIRTSCSY